MITMLAADWIIFSALLIVGLSSVATLLWLTWSATTSPKGDFVCDKCGLTDPTNNGTCEQCGRPVIFVLHK
jgi:hypothetical protein